MSSYSQQTFPLYKGEIPNSKPSKDTEEKEVQPGWTLIKRISKPTLSVFMPKEKSDGAAILICPGGGYWVNAIEHEGYDVAKKFNEMGITAFVLKYRIPNDSTMTSKETAPLQDVQQALFHIRSNAAQYSIDPARVGIMGFSAGGHLASTAGTHFDKPVIATVGNVRPDFMILIYPVISFRDSIGHIGSRDQLIGPNPPVEKIETYSNELQVTSATPPTFLVHASDDETVNVENSIVFFQALRKNNVPAELHIYQQGGHGFGMNNKTTGDQWMERLKNWLIASKLVQK